MPSGKRSISRILWVTSQQLSSEIGGNGGMKDNPSRQCDYILQSWDTAFEKTQRADYSAGTTWGIFNCEEDNFAPNIILLNTYKKRVEWVELEKDVFREYKSMSQTHDCGEEGVGCAADL
jgi:phage terminase large subunit-like protein